MKPFALWCRECDFTVRDTFKGRVAAIAHYADTKHVVALSTLNFIAVDVLPEFIEVPDFKPKRRRK